MIRHIWEEDFFSEGKHTSWICSKCFTGSLLIRATPTITRNDHYSACLRCSNTKCQEEYLSHGVVKYFSPFSNTEVSKKFFGEIRKRFYPKNFIPSLRLFQLSEFIPYDIAENVDKSFNVFWSDPQSSANAIRRALENLMDKLNIASERMLHERIDNYKSINPEISELLLAIKWIGNSGSHGETLTKSDLLDAYVILEHCLNELFPSTNIEIIKRLAAEINNRKGGRSKNE